MCDRERGYQHRSADQAGERQHDGKRHEPEMVRQHETREDGTSSGAEDIGEIESGRAHPRLAVGRDPQLGKIGQQGAPNAREQIDEDYCHTDDAGFEPGEMG
jgi:hypothetical protein